MINVMHTINAVAKCKPDSTVMNLNWKATTRCLFRRIRTMEHRMFSTTAKITRKFQAIFLWKI